MSWQVAIAVAGISLVLATLIKYSFVYLTERVSRKVHAEAVKYIIENHRDEIIHSIKLGVYEHLALKR